MLLIVSVVKESMQSFIMESLFCFTTILDSLHALGPRVQILSFNILYVTLQLTH